MPNTDERLLERIDDKILKLEGELDALRKRSEELEGELDALREKKKKNIKHNKLFMNRVTERRQRELNENFHNKTETVFGFPGDYFESASTRTSSSGGSRKKHRYHKQKTRSRRRR